MTNFQGYIYRIQTDQEGETKIILIIPRVYLNKVAELQDLLETSIVVEIEKADIKKGEDPSPGQFSKSEILLQELGWDKEQKEAYLLLMFRKRSRSQLTKTEMSQFLDFLVKQVETQEKGEQ